MKKGTCKHFNGVQHESCRCGVSYAAVTPRHSEPGSGRRLPCIRKGFFVDPENLGACDKYEEPSDEEIRKDRAEWDGLVDRLVKFGPIMKRIKEEHVGTDWYGKVECPSCGGDVQVSHSSVNGHIWAQCSTEDCLSFKE